MGEKLTLSNQAWQALFNASTKVRWPARLGSGTKYDLEFDDADRAGKMVQISAFRNAIREKYAARLGNEWMVGLAKNWTVKQDGSGKYELIDREAPLEVELDWNAYHALYWLCLAMAHPACPCFVDGGMLDEIVFPLVRKLDQWDDLMYDLGLREDEPDPVRQTLTSVPAKSNSSNGNH